MKPESLFIGALVCVNRDGLCIRKGTIVEVRAVDADDKLIERGLVGVAHCRPLDDNQFEGGIWCEYLDPIPLTAEIMEKNEFRHIGERFVFGEIDDALVELNLSINNSYRAKISVADLMISHNGWIKYIHELQHCLKLVGIEKEIIF